MPTINLNKNWKLRRIDSDTYLDIDIPYDAMLLDERSENAPTGKNECWIICNDYEYTKTFSIDSIEDASTIYINFEGIYRNAEVYINDTKIDVLPYGYTESIIDITSLVKLGVNNIKVIARNADQPNSRWYSGTGILRPVTLIILPKENILLNSIKVTTLDFKSKLVNVKLNTTSEGNVKLEVLKNNNVLYTFNLNSNKSVDENIELPDLELWSLEEPNLYYFRFTFNNHIETIRYGLRVIEVNNEGFFLNGNRVVLKGACIHSDSQTLGAITSPFLERRKVTLLKNVGYNSIRSAHNPICKYMLEACDEMGMLIMDEYVDCWYFQKTLFDYTKILNDYWKEDLRSMVIKDYNHPSVVMYSLGNEVGETAQDKGVALLQEFIDYTKSLDTSRPTTCGVNIVFNGMVRMGIGFYDEKKALKEREANKKRKQKVGSELFNDLTNLLSGKTLKWFSTARVCTKAIEKPFEILDIAGYNYGIRRYKKDLKKYPNRIICGSETFCSDAREFILLNKENPRIIGDFVWAGLDYLGEVAVGSRVDQEHCDNIMSGGLGWMAAGSGRIDLTGRELGEALYTKVAFEKEVCKLVTYSPKHYKMKHSVSSWKFSNAMPYYSYEGYENKDIPVEVYSVGDHFEVYQNDKLVKKGKCDKFAVNRFKLKYIPGTLSLKVYDINHNLIGEDTLISANKDELKLNLRLEQNEINLDELVYAHIELTDNNGVIKPLEERLVHVEVENGELLALASANPYNKEGFKVDTCKTFFGTALAIVKPLNKGLVKISASTEDLTNDISIKVN